MNINKIKLMTLSVCLIVSGTINAAIPTIPDVSFENIHANAHEISGAESMYQAWKDNKTQELDPFKRIKDGYSAEYISELSNLQTTLLDGEYETSIESMNELLLSELDSRRIDRNDSWRAMYESSFNEEEGSVDRALFDEEMDAWKTERATTSQMHYENMKLLLSNFSVTAAVSTSNVSGANREDTYNATANIVELMNNDFTTGKVALRDLFDDNIIRATQSSDLTEDTLAMANEFSSNCPACTTTYIPPVLNPIVPEDPPQELDPPIYREPVDRCWDRDLYGKYYFYECP